MWSTQSTHWGQRLSCTIRWTLNGKCLVFENVSENLKTVIQRGREASYLSKTVIAVFLLFPSNTAVISSYAIMTQKQCRCVTPCRITGSELYLWKFSAFFSHQKIEQEKCDTVSVCLTPIEWQEVNYTCENSRSSQSIFLAPVNHFFSIIIEDANRPLARVFFCWNHLFRNGTRNALLV